LREVPHYSTISKEVKRGRFKEVVGRECKTVGREFIVLCRKSYT